MQPEPGPQPDYNFIMNPGSAPKKSLFGGGGQKQRILTVLAGGGVLLIVIVLLFSLIFGGGTNNTEKMVGIAARQAEIIRVAGIGEKDSTSSDTKNFASTVRLSLTSAQNDLKALLDKQGRKIQAKELAAGQDKTTDETLTEAKQANRFDDVFSETIQKSLETYEQDLAEVFEASDSTTERTTIKKLYDSAQVLTGKD